MWGGRLFHSIDHFLKNHVADIVCVQEALSYKDGKDFAFLGSIERFARIGGYKYIAFAPVYDFSYLNGRAQFGNAILSRHPLTDIKTIFTRGELLPNMNFDIADHNVRNFISAKVKVNGKSYNIINHHGHVVHEHKNGTAETTRQMKMIADYLDSLTGKIVFCGDLNIIPNSPSLEPLNQRLRNLTAEYKLETTRTELTVLDEPCDYIFVSKDIEVATFRALPDLVSDHMPLLAELDS